MKAVDFLMREDASGHYFFQKKKKQMYSFAMKSDLTNFVIKFSIPISNQQNQLMILKQHLLRFQSTHLQACGVILNSSATTDHYTERTESLYGTPIKLLANEQ